MRTAMAGAGDFRRFGPYVLLRTSGAGGMGRVELALRGLPDGTAKLCVLKRMHGDFRTREHEARFRREATIALQLSHDAIAQSVALQEIDGELVLLQELVHGIDLRLLETRAATAAEPVPLPIALHIVSEIARALAHAHSFADLAIVHRDHRNGELIVRKILRIVTNVTNDEFESLTRVNAFDHRLCVVAKMAAWFRIKCDAHALNVPRIFQLVGTIW